MVTRKQFLRDAFKVFYGSVANAVDNVGPEEVELPDTQLRPPGAVKNFESVCTRCKDCIPVCPAKAIFVPKVEKGVKAYPEIDARNSACTMCEEMFCISVCEPGALKMPGKDEPFPIMGTAVIIEDSCLAFNDTLCRACVDVCPLQGTAIELKRERPVVHEEVCTGCGLCVQYCMAANEGAVFIRPVELA